MKQINSCWSFKCLFPKYSYIILSRSIIRQLRILLCFEATQSMVFGLGFNFLSALLRNLSCLVCRVTVIKNNLPNYSLVRAKTAMCFLRLASMFLAVVIVFVADLICKWKPRGHIQASSSPSPCPSLLICTIFQTEMLPYELKTKSSKPAGQVRRKKCSWGWEPRVGILIKRRKMEHISEILCLNTL